MNIKPVIWMTLFVSVLTALFAWHQNSKEALGGAISIPKALWLNWTLVVFFVMPLYLWREREVNPKIRTLFGWVLFSFVVRGAVEMFLLYFTRGWRCGYGISHDLFTFALVALMWLRLPAEHSAPDRMALNFAAILQVTLLIESLMAWLFSRVGSPSTGVYFAADTAEFRLINNFTWIVVAMFYPLFVAWLWSARRTASSHETPH